VANSTLHEDFLFQILQWSTTYQTFFFHCPKTICSTSQSDDCHHNHSIQFILKDVVGFSSIFIMILLYI
jgi:hypothetical protein